VHEQQNLYHAAEVLIEDKASGTQLIQELIADGCHGVARYQPTIDKIMRLHAQTTAIENGFVYIPETAPWLAGYLHEMTVFPNGKHDDQVDSTARFLDWFKTPMPCWGIFERTRRMAEKLKPPEPVYVRIKAPPGIGSVQTFSRRQITIGEDRIIEMSEEDANCLIPAAPFGTKHTNEMFWIVQRSWLRRVADNRQRAASARHSGGVAADVQAAQEAEPACRGPRPRDRRHATDTFACRRSRTTILSRCQRLLGRGRHRRSRRAITGPNFSTQYRKWAVNGAAGSACSHPSAWRARLATMILEVFGPTSSKQSSEYTGGVPIFHWNQRPRRHEAVMPASVTGLAGFLDRWGKGR
jgi:hypothetical protein